MQEICKWKEKKVKIFLLQNQYVSKKNKKILHFFLKKFGG